MFHRVVIMGGGVLGSQIGLMCAYTGHDVTFWLRSEGSIGRTKPKLDGYAKAMIASLEQAKGLIGNPMGARLYPQGLIDVWDGVTAEKIDGLIALAQRNLASNVHITLDMADALADADIVIEAMTEDPAAKTDLYRRMAPLMPAKTILCTNSSTLLPSQFAEATGRPDRFLAMHFANRIWVFNTAEIMGHAGTDPDVYRQVVEFAKDINMVPIEVHKEQPGYVLNSILVPFLLAAEGLWANDVADPETIDLTWRRATGAPFGPFQILDDVGLDTAYAIGRMQPGADDPTTTMGRISARLKEKIHKGETGVTAGKGFYDHSAR